MGMSNYEVRTLGGSIVTVKNIPPANCQGTMLLNMFINYQRQFAADLEGNFCAEIFRQDFSDQVL